MNKLVLIPKQDQDIPDYYGFTIHYLDGKTEDFQGIIWLNEKDAIFDVVTHDDLWTWIPVGSIRSISFDKSYSKCIAAIEKNQLNQQVEQQNKAISDEKTNVIT